MIRRPEPAYTPAPKAAAGPDPKREPVAAARLPRALGGGLQRRSPMLLLMVVSVFVLFVSFSRFSAGDGALTGATSAPAIVALIWLVCYLATSYTAFGTPYLFGSAYVICLFVFHYGLLMQVGLGMIQIPAWETEPLGPWVVRAGWCTNLALACIGIGFSASALRYKAPKKLPPSQVVLAVAAQNRSWLYVQGIGLLLASGLLLAGAIATQGNILALTRLKLFFLSDTRFISVFSMMSPSAAIALILGAQNGRQRRLAYLVSALVFIFFLISGQRSTAFFPLLVGAVGWVKSGRRINPVLAGGLIVSVLLLIPVVGYLRTLGTYGDITRTTAIDRASDYADIGSAFREMGSSIGPLFYTLMLIPSEEPYRQGSSYLAYMLDVLPNLGLNPDASTSRGAAEDLLRSKPTEQALLEMQPGDWASYHIIRGQFHSGGGAGFSGVAEPYFNFGLVGVVIFFTGMGLFLGRFDIVPMMLYRNWLLFGAVIFWHLLPTVRNGLGIFTKPASFILIALIIWKLVRRFVPIGAKAAAPEVKIAQSTPEPRSVVQPGAPPEDRQPPRPGAQPKPRPQPPFKRG